jgi:hypothetical protein
MRRASFVVRLAPKENSSWKRHSRAAVIRLLPALSSPYKYFDTSEWVTKASSSASSACTCADFGSIVGFKVDTARLVPKSSPAKAKFEVCPDCQSVGQPFEPAGSAH